FANDNLTYYNLNNGNIVNKPNSSMQQWALASWLGRVNYSLDNRYMFTFTGRTDCSTRLLDGNKWRFCPLVVVGWNMHNELFMRSFDKLSELKIRANYVISVYQSIGVGSTNARLNSIILVAGQTTQLGYIQASMANSSLGWERF